MMPSNRYRSSSCARRYAFSDFSRRCSSAESSACSSSSIWNGLLTKSARAALDRFDGVLHRAVAGDDDGDDVGIALDARRRSTAEPSMPGSRRSVTMMSKANSASRASAASPDSACSTTIAAIGQLLGDRLAQRGLVFDEQQMFRRISHLARRQYLDTRRKPDQSQPADWPIRALHLIPASRAYRYALLEARQHVERKTISIMKACELVGVSRRTIYNWLSSGKIEYVRTAGGSVRIFVDTLWRDPQSRRSAGRRRRCGRQKSRTRPDAAVRSAVEELLATRTDGRIAGAAATVPPAE